MTRAILLFVATVAAGFQLLTPEIDDGRQFLQPQPDQSKPLQRAAYAIATNQPSAEQQLNAILRSSPRSPEANQAHLLLSRLYGRTARYQSLASNFDRWRKNFPNSTELREQQDDVEQFRGLPDQSNSTPRPVQLHHDGNLWFPVSINGKPGTYLFDTGADVSILVQSEARRLGLKLRSGSVHIGDSSGLGFDAHTAIANEVMVGTTRFKNVSFVVMPDPDSTEGPSGIIGLPVILGMRSIRWNKSGTADVATPDDALVDRNMVFFGHKPLVQAVVETRPVFFTLDSGAENTDLNRRFADEFASLVAGAKRDEASIIGAGGTAKFEARKLDSLPIVLGKQPVTLSPAVVTMQSNTGIGGECCVGNLGDDILFSRSGFSLDFTRMTLRLF
jgi:predicted aspartyl protease